MIRRNLLTPVHDDSILIQLKECRCRNISLTMEKLYSIRRQYMYRLCCNMIVNGEHCNIELRLIGTNLNWHDNLFNSKYIEELIIGKGHVIIKRAGIYYQLNLIVMEEMRTAKTSAILNIADKKRRFVFH